MTFLGQQIQSVLCRGMMLPKPLEELFEWMDEGHCLYERPGAGRSYGTAIDFIAEGNSGFGRWLGSDAPEVIERICIFARTGGEGSVAAFWIADDGSQKIVHLGSGSGSTTVCVLAEDPLDFLRLIAIGYEELCWGEDFAGPPRLDSESAVKRNEAYVEWVVTTFGTTIPDRGSAIVKHPSSMNDDSSLDPFWQWTMKNSG
jgi:hypothetical protein